MDPQLTQPPVGTNNNQPSSQPPSRKPFPKKYLFIALGFVVLMIVIAIALISSGNKKQTNSSGRDDSVYVTREGYGDENDSIGDATAITASLTDKTVKFAGSQVVQPCALLTLDDLKDAKLYLTANSLTGPVERTYYDGRGSQQPSKLSDYLIPSGDVNSCSYSLKNDQSIDLEILQSFSVSPKALNDEIASKYSPIADASGLKAYKLNRENTYDKNETTYMVRANTATARLGISTPDAAVKEKLLELVAERLKKADSTPTPLTTFSLKSPVMDGAVYTSCDILNDDAFRRVVGVEPSALTQERYASSIGVVQDPVTNKNSNYSSYDCRRTGADGKGAFYINTTSYESAEVAKNTFAIAQTPRAMAQNIQPVTPAIGDESFFGDPAAMNNSLAFRKGKLVVYISYESPTGARLTPQQRIDALRPVLESSVKAISGF